MQLKTTIILDLTFDPTGDCYRVVDPMDGESVGHGKTINEAVSAWEAVVDGITDSYETEVITSEEE